MTIKPGIKAVLWMVPGAALMLLLVLVTAHFYKERNPAEQLAFKARRVDLAGGMQLALASDSEASMRAVLAITDEESQRFADQARAGTADLEREPRELEELLRAGGTQGAAAGAESGGTKVKSGQDERHASFFMPSLCLRLIF
jgi:hypothetical protein